MTEGTAVERAELADAEALLAEGRVRDAIVSLRTANDRDRDALLELELARLRHVGYDLVDHPARVKPPPAEPLTFHLVDGLPTVEPAQLSAAALSQAIAQYGCLFVPGLLDADHVARAIEGIDRTFDAFDRYQARPLASRDIEDRAWFEPFVAAGPYAGMERGGRAFTRTTGGMWTIESPRMLHQLIEAFDQLDILAAVEGHLGERPALSAAKCNVRRTPVDIPGGWHQDGSFIGLDITSVDVWIALSDCGRDAPGLDVVPHRFEQLLPPGPDTVVIPHELVASEADRLGAPIVGREYRPGDALLFDHMFVHRTAVHPAMTKHRYALETWFFGPSRYPAKQIPILC